MQYVCDAHSCTWFRIETLAEAAFETRDMDHAVEKHFQRCHDQATSSYKPPSTARGLEANIGLKAHVLRVMPRFFTLRSSEGKALVTAMLPPEGISERAFRPIIVGPNNTDPYEEYSDEIEALAQHLRLKLDRSRCYPY